MNTKDLKLIGRGAFSKVYRLNRKEVLIKSNDFVKTCMADDIESFLLPNIKKIGSDLFIMEFFPKVKSLKQNLTPNQYRLYKELRSLHVYTSKDCDRYFLWREQFKKIHNKRVREELLSILDSIAQYGMDVCFEISPRNVAVKRGKLILLDCFFIKSQLIEEINRRRRKKVSF